jgi:hypothetical protein
MFWALLWVLFADVTPPAAPKWTSRCGKVVDAGALEKDDRWLFGSFTRRGADEAVAALWGGTYHHNQWQVWLMHRGPVDDWEKVRKIGESCEGEVKKLHVSDRVPDILLYEEDCMHQGHNDGAMKMMSLQGGRPTVLYDVHLESGDRPDSRHEEHQLEVRCDGTLIDRQEIGPPLEVRRSVRRWR